MQRKIPKKVNPKWTRAKKQLFNICKNESGENRLIDQYLWAVKALGGLVQHDSEDIKAAGYLMKHCNEYSRKYAEKK